MVLQRMNFLARKAKAAFTYKTMVFIFGALCVFIAALYGVQMMRELGIKRNIRLTKKEIGQLNERKDKQLKLVEEVSRKRVGVTDRERLAVILQSGPRWSKVLSGLASRLPGHVWLEGVRVAEDSEDEIMLVVRGKTRSQRALTNFMLRLESSGKFRRTTLLGTKGTEGSEGELRYELKTYPMLSRF
jgi:Tfp pilus assembly protein PilN